jgi:hypothetical protein
VQALISKRSIPSGSFGKNSSAGHSNDKLVIFSSKTGRLLVPLSSIKWESLILYA